MVAYVSTSVFVLMLMVRQGLATEPPPNPVADTKAIVTAGHARFTVLTPAMIRMEWSADDRFEDRASFAFVIRRLDVPEYTTTRDGDWTVIKTRELTLRYRADGGRFAKDNLSIELQCAGKAVKWVPGMADTGNLRGTTRTLDGVSGACELEPGLLSRDGWAVVDDSKRLLFDSAPSLPHADSTAVGMAPTSNTINDDQPWVATRNDPDAIDWYFFGYGHDYKRALFDFTRVGGKIPLPPRYVFGAWWSRYWAYSDAELRQLVKEFDDHDVPLDVLVVDMDWHLDGWTGYTWNPKYFPDPKGFLDWAHEKGLKVTLNLHPADGVGKHEAAFPDFAKAMGLDPTTTERIPFDCTDRKYMDAYFKLLHHPLEKMGIDFWWMDWQQGTGTKVAGLDPLFWLNHLHWTDMARNPERVGATAVSAVQATSQPTTGATGSSSASANTSHTTTSPSTFPSSPDATPPSSPSPQPSPSRERESRLRPLIFSRWGGLGNHRYPIGFSGDTYCNWESLAFQPYFTATAGNVGYAYWSHDIGGHQPGKVDPELYVRWIQWGALSPILRTHTTKNPDAERRIWKFPQEYYIAAREAYLLRYQLLPYIYTMARKTYDTGLPLCRPLYYEWPDLDEAYARKGEYLFGDDLLVAPVTEAGDPMTGSANVEVWIPPGKWTNWFSGRKYSGPTTARLVVPLDEIPLFVRDGAVCVTQSEYIRTSEDKASIKVHLFPDDRDMVELYEDDGITSGYAIGRSRPIPIQYERAAKSIKVEIGPVVANEVKHDEKRHCSVIIHGIVQAKEGSQDGEKLVVPSEDSFYDGPCWFYSTGYFGFSNVLQLPYQTYGAGHALELRFENVTGSEQALIHAGLQGYLKGLGKVADSIPEAIPAPRLRAAERRSREMDNRDWEDSAVSILEGTHKYLTEINESELPSREKARSAVRLLGLWHRITARPNLNAPDSISVTAVVSGSLADELIDRMKLEMNCNLVCGYQSPAEYEAAFKALSSSGMTRAKSIDLLDPIRTIEVRTRVNLRFVESEKNVLEIEFPTILFPSINHWWVVGPFEATFEKGLATEYPPEGESKFDAAAKYDGKGGMKIEWKRVFRAIKAGDDPTKEHFVDLNELYDSPGNAVAYGLTYLSAPTDMDATLAIGSDDGAAVWLNGAEVYRQDVGRAYTSKQDRVPVKLKKGANPLLIKVKQGTGGWGFCVHVENEKGEPLPEVKAVLER